MKVFKFILAVFFITAALGGVIQKQFPVSIVFLILGTLLLPPISEQIKENFKLWQSKGIRYVTYIFLFFIAGATMDKSKLPKAATGNDKTPTVTQTEIDRTEKPHVVENGKSGVYNADGEKIGTQETTAVDNSMDDSDFWDNYSLEVKERIHGLIRNKDCQGLQIEFETAYQNNEAQKRRTGRNNAELLDFIDNNMRKMDCYNRK
ncbi:hypothetical protein [Chryseobacterium sp. SC28]|uniref:hypothetical protein n=1 Tax=Chryseobacterium sp. SC28 TaxID=2268028 RepID=UPI000F655656|nr:hypothetical protein [Chryseobacterium sp. SC28]RRQ46501.1 hypothetical protein DTW91_04800 [Chryseobacterium sp. SC28]